ncbi:kinase-like protein [Fomitiporia mediterranea MF3/22]|uniref:kinase-like protein n=1 Tax=Fomitiporia mediterranea (strain MF3/22) TaxID=694068 RepID=UPI0004407335|nr:kinase-like protein [Fomitiporia mediterranea MF3/22]EJD05086.1 kinase-like protein [Fomitiporia mediterranea MF3/22]
MINVIAMEKRKKLLIQCYIILSNVESFSTPTRSVTLPLPPLPPPHYETDLMKIGSTVQGYTSLEKIGKGKYGTVLKCWKQDTAKVVAVKVLKGDGTDETRRQQLNEWNTMRRIGIHKNIIGSNTLKFFEYTYNSYVYRCIAMEYAEGGTLEAYMRSHKAIPLINIKSIIWQVTSIKYYPYISNFPLQRQISEGLKFLHGQNCIHCDFNVVLVFTNLYRPGNVLLMRVDILELRIADFGTSTWIPKGHSEFVYAAGGAIGYFPPERAKDPENQIICSGTDMFPLGIILWELFHGWHMFPCTTTKKKTEFYKLTGEKYWDTYQWKQDPEGKSSTFLLHKTLDQ